MQKRIVIYSRSYEHNELILLPRLLLSIIIPHLSAMSLLGGGIDYFHEAVARLVYGVGGLPIAEYAGAVVSQVGLYPATLGR